MRKSRLRGPGVEPFGSGVCRRNDTPQNWCSPHITDMTYTVHNRSHYSILPPATGIVSITGLCIRAYSRSCHSANTCVRVHACACVHALENVTSERAFTVWNHNFSSAEVSHCALIISGQNNAASNKSNIKNGMWPVDSRAHWSFFKMRNKTHACTAVLLFCAGWPDASQGNIRNYVCGSYGAPYVCKRCRTLGAINGSASCDDDF